MQMVRPLTRFHGNDGDREVWAARTRQVGAPEAKAAATQVEKPYKGSFLHWRFETLPNALTELARFVNILRTFFRKEFFSSMDSRSLR